MAKVNKYLREAQFSFYWEQGYLIIKNFICDEDADHLYESLKRVATSDFKTLLHVDREEDLLKQNPDCDQKSSKYTGALVRKMQVFPKIVRILEELYEREIVALQSIILFKEKGSPYQNTPWNPHQDNSYVQNKNNLYIAVGYPLLDFSPENGGLFFYPGSHKEGILNFDAVHGALQKPGESAGNNCGVPDKYKKFDLFMEKGDVVIFHGNLIHGSYTNTTERSRPFLVINYLPLGEDFNPGKTSNRRVIRCH